MSTDTNGELTARDLIAHLCRLGDVSVDRLSQLEITGEPGLPTSFQVGLLAQVTMGAAAHAAAAFGCARGQHYPVYSVDMRDAECECTAHFKLNGKSPATWAPLSGLYACNDGFVRVHANFDHHRDGALAVAGLAPSSPRELLATALNSWSRYEFEDAAAEAGLPVVALRTFKEWDNTEQAAWLAGQPLFTLQRIGAAPPLPFGRGGRPLSDVRVLDLTRILAGPVAGRTLAAHGADVMLVNSPHLPNIEHIADTSRGKRSVHLDLTSASGKTVLQKLVSESHVFIQGYRPGGLSAMGFSPSRLATLKPGIVSVSLSAYGRGGPWAMRRGFDSLVQSATGFNFAEQEHFGSKNPQGLPVQILDFASGFLIAFAVSAALLKQQSEGGTWHIDVSLAQVAHWLRSLGRADIRGQEIDLDGQLLGTESGFGDLACMPHGVKLSGEPISYRRLSMPPGSHPADWG